MKKFISSVMVCIITLITTPSFAREHTATARDASSENANSCPRAAPDPGPGKRGWKASKTNDSASCKQSGQRRLWICKADSTFDQPGDCLEDE